jgi:NADH dehydrogenase
LTAAGVEVVEGDIELPETLAACLDGVSAVVSTASSFPVDPRPDAIARVDRAGQLDLVAAAEQAGVRRFVYLSFPPYGIEFPFQDAKRAVEVRLREAALEHVILQPGKFMDVWFSPPLGFDPAAGHARLYGGGEVPVAWVAVDDVAEVAAQAVDAREAAGRTFAFGGPEALSQREVVTCYERLLGRSFTTEDVPVEALRGMHAGGATPTEVSLGGILLGATAPDAIDSTETWAAFPYEPTSVERFAAGAVRRTD